MKKIAGVICFCLLTGTALQAEVKLPPSQFALDQKPTIQYQVETGSGFSEVQDENAGDNLRKSPWRAFLMSLIIPGAGEQYTGSITKSRIFMAAEVGGWVSLLSFKHLGKWREDDYKLQAAREAGADVAGKDDRYFDVVGFYSSREEYNKIGGAFDQTREYYPDTEAYFWNWSSQAAREKYRDLKNDSKSYYRNADFALGFLIANHFLSAVDAFWSAKRHNRGIESGFSGVDLKMLEDGGWQLTLNARF
ncbi:MAG: hypothetical protein WBP29_01360 [Candidatus Zixiibacteriota bacterium]